MSWSATPNWSAYSRERSSSHPKILMQIIPTAEATRRQYSEQIVERLIPRVIEIHGHAVDDVFEGIARQAESIDERLKALALRRLGLLARETPIQFLPPALHGLTRGRSVPSPSSTASSTARQKSQTATMARRSSAGSTRNE